uniref:C-type lectin domain-containing protein n=1 Tax=Sparus aurata TaxID=8175 RepID=A0A671TSH0_SPAAU
LASETNVSIAEVVTSCPDGWTGYSIRCFLQGGNLASSMTQRKTLMYPLTWLGGCDAAQGTWLWSDGTHFGFNFWATRQPDNVDNANCLLITMEVNLYRKKFANQLCDNLRSFVCAKNL